MPLIIPANSAVSGGFDVANSLRFNDGSSDYLTRSFGATQTSTAAFTISVWVKRSTLGTRQSIFAAYDGSSAGGDDLEFETDDTLSYNGSGAGANTTSAKFRDTSAWLNIVLARNSGASGAANQVKIYVNGVLQSLSTNSGCNTSQFLKNGLNSRIGTNQGASQYWVDMYMSEFVAIDGQMLDATSFGEFDEDSGIWKPIDVSGLTFGNNGFYLDFEDSSALGNDAAGSNNFTVNNLTAIDQTTDTCTNNFATLNALAKGSSSTFSEGNLKNTTGGAYNTSTSTIGLSSGKWYWEYKLPASSLNYVLYGITTVEFSANSSDVMTNFKTSYSKTAYANEFRYNTAGGSYSTDTTGFSTDSTGDIVKIALDLDNNFIYVGNGNSWYNSGNPESGASGTGAAKAVVAGLTYFPMMITLSNSMEINFGSPPYSESGGNSDGNGYGNFNQAVPSGYYSLNTKNLAEYGG